MEKRKLPEKNLADALQTLDDTIAPPQGLTLQQQLEAMRPVKTRQPRRQWLTFLGVSGLYATILLALTGLRADLRQIAPTASLALLAIWAVAFAATSYYALVPKRGFVAPRWRLGALIAGLAAVLLPVVGVLATPTGVDSVHYPATLGNIFAHSSNCAVLGFVAAIVPAALALRALRGAVFLGSRWVAAAMGAAGGALGGLVLHLHCPIVERFHVALVHGGLIVMFSIIAAMVGPRSLDG